MHYTDLTWIEIDHEKLIHNYHQYTQIAQDTKIIPIIKANAYGHGMIDIAHTLEKEGVYKFGVATFCEALQLRQAGIQTPIIVIGCTNTEQWQEAARLGIEIAIFSEDQIRHMTETYLQSSPSQVSSSPSQVSSSPSQVSSSPSQVSSSQNTNNIPLKIHIKIETGMNRLGFKSHEATKRIREIWNFTHTSSSSLGATNPASPQIKIEGIYTHFADAETPENPYTYTQLENFNMIMDELSDITTHIPDIHAAASGAAISHSETTLSQSKTRFTAMRLGIALYGMWPSEATQLLAKHSDKIPTLDLQPIMTWKTRIAHINNVQEGESVGYGCTYTAYQNMRIAILPIGYADGYLRSRARDGQVLVQGKRCKIVGRICMNLCMIDITHLPQAQTQEEVVLLGTQHKNTISTQELARGAETINYEITTCINWDIPRIAKLDKTQ